MEEALWAAMRSLDEKISVLRRMGARSGDKRAAEYQQEAGQFDRQVETIRQILIRNERIEMSVSKRAKRELLNGLAVEHALTLGLRLALLVLLCPPLQLTSSARPNVVARSHRRCRP
jgi:hypothetical protein